MCASSRAAARARVLIITHKFREVMAYADDVTVLRRGQGGAPLRGGRAPSPAQLAAAMMGEAPTRPPGRRRGAAPAARCTAEPVAADAQVALQVEGLRAHGRPRHARRARPQPARCAPARSSAWPASRATASASWSRRWSASAARAGGTVRVMGQPYAAHARARTARLKVRSLPEEPLRNACVAELSVAENMALRDFDQPPLARAAALLRCPAWRSRAPRVDRRIRRQDAGRGRADPQPVGRQRAARGAGARAGRRRSTC